MRPSTRGTEHEPFLCASARGTAAVAAPAASPPSEGCLHSEGHTGVLPACQQGQQLRRYQPKTRAPELGTLLHSQNPTPRQPPKTASSSQGCSGGSGEAWQLWMLSEGNNLCICVHLLPWLWERHSVLVLVTLRIEILR